VSVSEHHKNSGAVYLQMHHKIKISGVSFVQNCTTRFSIHISPVLPPQARYLGKTDGADLGQDHISFFSTTAWNMFKTYV